MTKQEKGGKIRKGFSLIESLISLSLFLIIILTSFELFGITRDIFLKLKKNEDGREAALAALDKMSIDLLDGGSGLIDPIRLGILEGVSQSSDMLIILSKEKELFCLDDLVEGQTRISLDSTIELKKGRDICIFDSLNGEVKSISSVDKESIVISSPLNLSYIKDKVSVILVKKISLYLDEKNPVLRRKVNSSPAQPLLEETTVFGFDLDKAINLVRLRVSLKSTKEKSYEISVFPKNTALATAR
jgi:prepilin-type N-terminal cleavage/methylation domain-containing protein